MGGPRLPHRPVRLSLPWRRARTASQPGAGPPSSKQPLALTGPPPSALASSSASEQSLALAGSPASEEALAAAGSPWRLLTIAADLLPGEIVEARQLRRTRRIVVAGLAVVLLGVTSWYGVVGYQTEQARSDLDHVNDDVQRQMVQQRAFADLISVQTESKSIGSQLSVLFGSDLQWARLLVGLRGAAPAGVRMLGVFGTLNSQQQAAADDGQLPGTSHAKVVGTVTVTASAPNQSTAAAYVDALGKVPGVADPLLGDANVVDGALQFTVRLNITADALGGRYSPSPGPSGSAAAGGNGTGGG